MLEIGVLKNFDSGTYKAGVQLAGSLTTYFDDISVAKNIPSSALIIGNYVIVAIPGGNPKDACVIATWPRGSPGGGAFLDLSDTPSSYSGQAGKAPKVNSAENALEFARFLLAPTGTAEWENRTYQGWELLTTATEYTVGSGQDFATLQDAAASLKGLILIQQLTIKLMEDQTLTSICTFDGLLYAGGTLLIDLNDHDIEVDYDGSGLDFRGPLYAYVRDTTGSPYAKIKAGTSANSNAWLLRVANLASVTTRNMQLDANSRPIEGMILLITFGHMECHVNTIFLDTGSAGTYTRAVQCGRGSRVDSRVILGVAADDITFSGGGMVIDSDGHIHTDAGEFTP